MRRILDFLLNLLKKQPMKDTKLASRKYKLAMLIFIMTSLLCAVPPCLSVFVFKAAPLIILSGTEYVTILSTLMGIYFSANVYQKKIISENTVTPPKEEEQK